jgi:hypothetical protein
MSGTYKSQWIFKILAILSLLICFSCGNSSRESNTKEKEVEIRPSTNLHEATNKYGSLFTRTLTYQEIVDKQEEIKAFLKEWKQLLSDSVYKEREASDSLYFYKFLTTQFRYMLSSELRLLRNEFYARKGYVFRNEDLLAYFKNKSWYKPQYNNLSSIPLSAIDKAIIDSIMMYEKVNRDYTEKDFQHNLKTWFKEHKNFDYGGCYVDIPSVLFRRNIGHHIPNRGHHNKFWFNGEYLPIQIIDTLPKNILLFGLYGQIMCPAEYCLMGGEIFTCDSALNYIDSHSVEFENFKRVTLPTAITYEFKVETLEEKKMVLKIDQNGFIQDYE